MVWLIGLRAAVALLFISPDGFDSFQPPKAIVTRIVDVAIIACLVLAFYRFGDRVFPRTWLHAAVGVYLCAVVAATLAAADRYVAINGEIVTLEGLTFTMEMAVLYIAAAVAIRERKDWRDLALFMAGAVFLIVVYAAIQALGLDPFHGRSDAAARTLATLGNPEILSVCLGTALGAVVGLIPVARDRRELLVAAFCAVVLALAGGTTGTRAFLLSLAASAFAALVIRLRLYGLRNLGQLLAVTGLVALLATALLLGTPVGTRVFATFAGSEPVQDRLLLYTQAVDAFADRPLLGWGPGNFEVATVPHRSLELTRLFGPLLYYTSAHDLFLESFVGTGLIGGLSLLILFVACAWRLSTHGFRYDPVVASCVLVALVGYSVQALVSIGSVAVDWYPWFAFGGAVAIATNGDAPLSEARRVNQWKAAGGVALIAVLAAIVSWPAYAANDYAGRATRATASRQTATALEAANKAVNLDPDRARYWGRLGQVFAAAGRNREAADSFTHAADRAPYHAEYWNNLAISRALQAAAGDSAAGGFQAALAAADAGLNRDPFYSPLLYTKAFTFQLMNDNDQAALFAAQAIVVYPKDNQYDALLQVVAARATPTAAISATATALSAKESTTLEFAAAQAALRAGDRDSAVVHLRRALDLDPGNTQARDLMNRL